MKSLEKKYANFTPDDREEFRSLIGWTITNVGMTTEAEYVSPSDWAGTSARVEGGLTLLLTNGKDTRKIILGYTELGEWVEADIKVNAR